MKPTQAKVILRKAVKIIETQGWYPGDKLYGARCCALAIDDAAGDTDRGEQVRKFFAKKAGLPSSLCTSIGKWNDRSTKAEVLAAMRKAAK